MARSLSATDLHKISFELKKDKPDWNEINKTAETQTSFFRIFNRSQFPLISLVNKMNQTFACLEQEGVKVFDAAVNDPAFLEQAERYRQNRRIYLGAAQKIIETASKVRHLSTRLKEGLQELKAREVGFRYSLGMENGGLNSLGQPDSELLQKVTLKAAEWKKKEKQAIDKELNVLEKEQLGELAKYPEWLNVALTDSVFLKEVFNWTLKDFNSVEVLVKCYETRTKLKAALLSSNLGYVKNLSLINPEDEVLAFRTVPTKVANVSKKILTAAIYHGNFKTFEPDQQERVNILKPGQKIHFKQGDYTVTVEEFLRETSQKNSREVRFSLCGHWGFANFHNVKGVWDETIQDYIYPEMTEQNWLDKVPPARIASHAELEAQYGEKVNNRNFFFKVMAKRQTFDLTALDAHSFLQLYVREEDGNWRVLNLGFFAHRFQQGILDGLWLAGATLKRVVCLMDQNGNYTHRHEGAFPLFRTNEEYTRFLNRIYYVMQKNGVFQLSGRNCAHPIQKIVEKSLTNPPNFFKMRMTQGKAGVYPLDVVLAWADKQWNAIRWLVVTIIHNLFLSMRSLRVKNGEKVVNHSARRYLSKTHDIYNPSYLPHQIALAHKTGKGPFTEGELYWGQTANKLFQRKKEDNLKITDRTDALTTGTAV